tara:strand:- start:1306 stop:1845 length:540 start_codon:yes stop_codon:yes gene_type:complete
MINSTIAPKVIRKIWVGSDLPIRYRQYFKDALKQNPDYKGELWIDHSLLTDIEISALKKFARYKNIVIKDVWDDFFDPRCAQKNNIVYTENELRFFFDSISGVDGQYCKAADIFRALLLYNFGGVYLDTDNQVLKSLGNIDINNEYGAIFPPGMRAVKDKRFTFNNDILIGLPKSKFYL